VWQQPLSLGADFVLHSTTKYLNGHSDVVGGAIVSSTPELHERMVWWANCIGVTGAPFDSFMTLRGIRTLHARLRVHGDNALEIANVLNDHPAVKKVHYPGLSSHPQHQLARRQQTGFGAMVSFELRGGTANVCAFLEGLRTFSLAESLGGVESLVAHPSSMTHAAMDADAQRAAGIGETLLRLSVGIEAVEDLLEDLRAGLDRAAAIK
jgi:cystathionine gamma-synthase